MYVILSNSYLYETRAQQYDVQGVDYDYDNVYLK